MIMNNALVAGLKPKAKAALKKASTGAKSGGLASRVRSGGSKAIKRGGMAGAATMARKQVATKNKRQPVKLAAAPKGRRTVGATPPRKKATTRTRKLGRRNPGIFDR